jgi:PIN domain nuclease of toxin-antitoxin system
MIRAVADTHAVIWFLYKDARLPASVRDFMNDAAQAGDQIAVSAITLIEVAYLVEKSRIAIDTFERITDFLAQPNSMLREIAVDREVAKALRQVTRTAVPDLPDRIIAATGLMLGVPVISRDRKITASTITTIW